MSVYINQETERKEILSIVKRILSTLRVNPDSKAFKVYSQFTAALADHSVYRFTCAVANHAFDDYPETFGISKEEGHQLRAYLHNSEEEFLSCLKEAGLLGESNHNTEALIISALCGD